MAKAVAILLIALLVCTAFAVLLDAKVERVSRRFANLSFVLWIVRETSPHGLIVPIIVVVLWCYCFSPQTTVSGFVMVAVFAVDLMSFFIAHLSPNLPPHVLTPFFSTTHLTKDSQPVKTARHLCVMSAIDYNQFTFFILANLSTGVVNFAMDTMAAGSSLSLAIVTGHMLVVCLIVTVLQHYKIKLV